jgi:hypothetical protein
LSYKVILDNDDVRTEPNKDEVISLLIAEWNERTGQAITVIWPDGSKIEYVGFE